MGEAVESRTTQLPKAVIQWVLQFGGGLQETLLIALAVLLTLLFASLQSAFLSLQSLDNIVVGASTIGVAALGMTLVILTAGIDLSVGSVMGLGGVLASGLLGAAFSAANPVHLPPLLAIFAALVAGAFIGLLNGVSITTMRVAPFIATLSTMALVRGLVYFYTDLTVQGIPGSPITFSEPLFDWIGSGSIGGVPVQAALFLVLAVALALILKFTPFGRDLYAVGGNAEIARLAGINVKRIVAVVYVTAGALAALSGILMASRLSSASPLLGTGYELEVITVVAVGGASLSGGRGSILGTALGAVVITILDNGLDMLNIVSFYQNLVKGAVLVVAVSIDQWYQKRLAAAVRG